MSAKYTALTLNWRGLNNPVKHRRVSDALVRERPDITFLQETHLKSLDPSNPRVLHSKWFSHQFFAPGSTKARGVAILVSKTLPFVFLDSVTDPRGRYVFVKCTINNDPYTLASIYAPNVDQLSFISNTLSLLNEFKAGELLIGGDLNYVSDRFRDRFQSPATVGSQSRKPRYFNDKTQLPDILDFFNLVDVWRALYPSARQYTFFSSVHQSYTRIDVIMASKSLFGEITSADIGIRSLSDHAWVTCHFSKRVTDGKGPNWLLNKSLLSDPVICETAATEITNYFLLNKDCGVPSEVVWDAFKAVIRGHFISVGASCKKAKLQVVTDLKARIAWLEE